MPPPHLHAHEAGCAHYLGQDLLGFEAAMDAFEEQVGAFLHQMYAGAWGAPTGLGELGCLLRQARLFGWI